MNKVALIIGNAAYPESSLNNPVNDAVDIQDNLKRLGFKTFIRKDATIQDMDEALTEYSDRLSSCDIALFFFAGHGMQIEGRNYLTAVDTNFNKEKDAKYSSLPLDKVIEVMEDGENQTSIIILDACRTNPYERRWRGTESRGLAPVYAPKGMLIAYATSPGQVASDGDGRNGSFTHAFLKHVSTPDITVEDLFKRVRNTLSSTTRGRQISWEHTSLMGDFYFNYSAVTDELITEYGEHAIADSRYKHTSKGAIYKIISDLKSHDWYSQNPAIKKIKSFDFNSSSKDDLFVLGRNIYQAACGSANDAISFVNNLNFLLSRFEFNYSFHILNGILFEIYFDSNGRYRQNFKSNYIDEVFELEETEPFNKCFSFIKQALGPYLKTLFYVPSTARRISVDIVCVDLEEDLQAVQEVFYEGDNVLYDEAGSEYYDPTRDRFMRTRSKDDFVEKLSQAMATPRSKLKVVFNGLDEHATQLLTPYDLNVRRLAG